MAKLRVKGMGAPPGSLILRVNKANRGDTERFDVVIITDKASGKSSYAMVLGHDNPSCIYIPFDMRKYFELNIGDEFEFTIQKVGWWGKLRWYLASPDPSAHVSAWLAVLGFVLGIIGTVLAVLSFK